MRAPLYRNQTFKTTQGLRVHQLCKAFGSTQVLNHLSLDIAQGDIVAILGSSGSGKTTLLRLLCGFDTPDAGSIELGSHRVADGKKILVAPEKRHLGYVAQEGALFPHLNVAQNIAFGLPRAERKTRKPTPRIRQLLGWVELPEDYATRSPAALSGGEQQRVTLARALARKPDIILLDEPFSALDAGLRDGLRHTLLRALRQSNTTAILVTHDQQEALSIADRVAVLQHGKIAQIDTPQNVYRFPRNVELARFVGDAIITRGHYDGHCVDGCFGRLQVARPAHAQDPAPHSEVDVMLRPEQIQLLPDDAPASAYAEVKSTTFYGSEAMVNLRLQDCTAFSARINSLQMPRKRNVGFRVLGDAVIFVR